MPAGRALEVHTFPSADVEFLRAAQAAIARWSAIDSTVMLVSRVQAELQVQYPDAVVRLRAVHTQLDEHLVILYAFRDGRVG